MQVEWFKELRNPSDIEERKNLVRNNQKLLDILDKILYNMSIEEEDTSKDQYSSPSWAYLQADRNGALRTIKRIRKLLEIKEI